jgi:hypothetical protein
VSDYSKLTDAPDGGVNGSNWYVFGGTSLAAAAMVGVINAAGRFAPSSARELAVIYNHRTVTSDYRDIASGDSCGLYNSFSAVAGWDYCTGVGAPLGYEGK